MVENIVLSFQGLWSHKFRSFLTMLGIIIGISSIITIVSTIKGTNEQIKENLIGAGNNVVTVKLMQDGYETDMQYSALPEGVTVISEETKAELDELESVEETSLYRQRSYVEGMFYKNSSFNGDLYGVDGHFLDVNDYQLNYGRNFLEEDFQKCRKVAIVDTKTAGKLFSGEYAVGRILEIQGEPFTVIGVVAKSSASEPNIQSFEDYMMYMDISSGSVFVPDKCWPIIYRYDEPQYVAVKAVSTDDMTTAGKNVAEKLNASQIQNTAYSYEANDLLEQATRLQSLSETTNTQLLWIAGISLLVGGIGVMNIMLVSVTERTKEIGLKMALGARQKVILAQFLTEAAVLTSMGGILGVVCGIGLAQMLSKVMGTPVVFSIPACVVAVVFSIVIGILFGLIPALKASRLNPIEALRHE
ncbi:MAG: ABC transporter permease [Ruminococcus sp.]|nr:ABC transporter permease [Ruminococcus sp.]